MQAFDLLLLEEGLYSNIAVIGDKEIFESLKLKLDLEMIDIDYIEKFEDYTRNPRVYHRVINSLQNVDYKKIFNSIHHQGWLITTPKIYDYSLFELLDKVNFVAINETDKFITAKRMHGWGN